MKTLVHFQKYNSYRSKPAYNQKGEKPMPSRAFSSISTGVADTISIALLNRNAKIVLVVPDKTAASQVRAQFEGHEHFEKRSLKGRPIYRAYSGSSVRIFHAKGLLAGRFKPHDTKLNTYIEAGTLDAHYIKSAERDWLKTQGEKHPEVARTEPEPDAVAEG